MKKTKTIGRPARPIRHWLIQARQDSNKTYPQLSKEIGVTSQAIYYWEVGARTPSPRKAKKVGKVLNIDWTKFYDDSSTNQT